MTTQVINLPVPPGRVYRFLADPERFPTWLVGAQRIRSVDPGFPEPGSCFHHVVGVWPGRVKGATCVIAREQDRELVLRAGMGFLGAARVRFNLQPVPDGTRLVFAEEPERGAIRLLWRWARPLVALALLGRNRASLDRLREELLTEAGVAPRSRG